MQENDASTIFNHVQLRTLLYSLASHSARVTFESTLCEAQKRAAAEDGKDVKPLSCSSLECGKRMKKTIFLLMSLSVH